jgi:membrane fusion protein, multidrug efflux system
MRRRKIVWVAVAAGVSLAVVAGLLVAAGGRAGSRAGPEAAREKEPRPVAVTVAPVEMRPVERTVNVVGNLEGLEDVTITPKIEGRAARILHEVGDTLKPGDVLLEIDDTDHRLAVSEARKALEMDLARIGLVELPAGTLDVESIPTVARADAVEKNARIKLDRLRSLPADVVSQEDVTEREAEHRVAQAMKAEAVMQASATLAAARHRQALLEIAEQKLRETKVRVPVPTLDQALAIDGVARAAFGPTAAGIEYVVAERFVSEGEMVRAFPSVAAFRLVVDRVLEVRATVPERYAGRIRTGQPVAILAESHPGETFAGKVSRVSPTVDRASRTFWVEAMVPNEDRRLKAGSFVKVSITTDLRDEAATVPEEAMVTFAGVVKVFVVSDGKSRSVEVETGARLGGGAGEGGIRIEVTGDLKPGDLVVTSGHSMLADGTPVRIRSPGEDPAGAEAP